MTRDQEVAWAAGLFEGEGSISLVGKRSVTITLGSTDIDVLERFAEVVGKGRIGDPRQHGTNKPIWRWQACGDNAAYVLNLFLPMLGKRRSSRAIEALAHRTPVITECRQCGVPLVERYVQGQTRAWCSNACKCKGHREGKATPRRV